MKKAKTAMGFLKYGNYRGEVECKGERFRFSAAAPEDALEIAEMYGEIAIDSANYKEKLDPGHENCFSRTGGMFEIHTSESIEKEIREGSTFFAVLKDSSGSIAASFWFAAEDPHFAGFNPESYPFCRNRECAVVKAMKEGKTASPRELIVRPGRLRNAAHVMFYTIFHALAQNGYTHSLFEVYSVKGYEFAGEHIPLDMINRRSFDMSRGTGAKYIGDSPEFGIRLGALSITIIPKVFCCDYAAILPALGQKLKDGGIAITFGGETLEKHQGEDFAIVPGGVHNVAGADRSAI
jgi:hypothetical protein